jgi:hypothetical protein
MSDTFSALRTYWSQRGLTPSPGVSPAELADFEARYGQRLPPEVRAYFTTVNGVLGGRDGAWDSDLIAFWPLAEVQPLTVLMPETGIPEAYRYLAFADWSIDAWFYAACLPLDATGEAPVCIVVDDDRTIPVADSLTEFFRRYQQDDDVVRYGPSTDPEKPARSVP